jgi:hypothetical protein
MIATEGRWKAWSLRRDYLAGRLNTGLNIVIVNSRELLWTFFFIGFASRAQRGQRGNWLRSPIVQRRLSSARMSVYFTIRDDGRFAHSRMGVPAAIVGDRRFDDHT